MYVRSSDIYSSSKVETAQNVHRQTNGKAGRVSHSGPFGHARHEAPTHHDAAESRKRAKRAQPDTEHKRRPVRLCALSRQASPSQRAGQRRESGQGFLLRGRESSGIGDGYPRLNVHSATEAYALKWLKL